MAKKTGRIASEACQLFADIPTRTLATKIFNKHPGVFSSIEHARTLVRYYRGQSGAKNKDKCKNRDNYSANGDNRRGGNVDVIPSAKILSFDIETAPHMAYVWKCFKEYVSPEQMIQHTTVICWAAKWLGDDEVLFDDVPHDDYTNDKGICESLWKLIDEADIIISHNGRAFDHPLMRTRWLAHGMPPPSPYQTVDTCKLAQKQFRFPRSKLESVARYLEIGHKTSHDGFQLWRDCMDGDEEAWAKMREYNINDVILLEDVYMRLRPWDRQHPNVSLDYDDVMRCIVCGSTALESLNQPTRTQASTFESYRCQHCGKVMRSRSRHKPDLPAAERLAHSL